MEGLLTALPRRFVAGLLVSSHFVPRSFCTYFSHFLPSLSKLRTQEQPFRTQVISYQIWSYLGQMGTKWLYGGRFIPKSFRTQFRMYGWIFTLNFEEGKKTSYDWKRLSSICHLENDVYSFLLSDCFLVEKRFSWWYIFLYFDIYI